MSKDILDELLHRSDVLEELSAITIGMENKNKSSEMLARHNLLIIFANAR